MGIRACIGLPPQEVERLEGEDDTNPNLCSISMEFCRDDFRKLANGSLSVFLETISMLRTEHLFWNLLVESGDNLLFLEDAMMAYRIVRAPPERRVFKIDVG